MPRNLLTPQEGDYTVYVLIDPRDRTYRYVGVTNNLEKRLSQHIQESRYEYRKTAKHKWVREVQAEGLQPELIILEKHDRWDRACNSEWEWIRHFVKNGFPLLNNIGTACFDDPVIDDALIEKLRNAHMDIKFEVIRLLEKAVSK